jgi:hypothetical protein
VNGRIARHALSRACSLHRYARTHTNRREAPDSVMPGSPGLDFESEESTHTKPGAPSFRVLCERVGIHEPHARSALRLDGQSPLGWPFLADHFSHWAHNQRMNTISSRQQSSVPQSLGPLVPWSLFFALPPPPPPVEIVFFDEEFSVTTNE